MKPYRIIILGAGFSRPAGLPLGRDLLPLVLERARAVYGDDNAIVADLQDFSAYKSRCDGVLTDPTNIDLEEFIGFLDIEHSLRLSGSDTLTEEGNRSQLAIRRLIGSIIQFRTPRDMATVPSVYARFVAGLQPGDTVVTFNYDILLERLLEFYGKPYRLFPSRYAKVFPTYSEVDRSYDEVVVLKLHGSVDWFYRREFDLTREALRANGQADDPQSSLFGSRARCQVKPLVDGPRPEREELGRMYRVTDPDTYYEADVGWEAPYLLAPSSAKALYASPLIQLWNGLGEVGALNFGLAIIGFSMPSHDEYLRQLIYRIARNFQYCEPELVIEGRTKSPMAVIDYRTASKDVDELKKRYAFLDWSRTQLFCDGLDERAVEFVFHDALANSGLDLTVAGQANCCLLPNLKQ